MLPLLWAWLLQISVVSMIADSVKHECDSCYDYDYVRIMAVATSSSIIIITVVITIYFFRLGFLSLVLHVIHIIGVIIVSVSLFLLLF